MLLATFKDKSNLSHLPVLSFQYFMDYSCETAVENYMCKYITCVRIFNCLCAHVWVMTVDEGSR